MKNIVVTGATSMIGSSIIDACLKNGVEKIYAVVRPKSGKLDRLSEDRRIIKVECAIEDYIQLPDIIGKECDVFYHIAWSVTGVKRNEDIIGQAENVKYTINALKAAKNLNCKKFIGAGSQAEYGKLDIERISPNSPACPEQPYGIAKYAAGKLAAEEAKLLGIDCLWVRIFSVYGKYDKESTMIASTIRKLLNNEDAQFTKAEQRWDYLESSDAGNAFYLIGEKATGNKVYCLGSGYSRPLCEYIGIIGDLLEAGEHLKIGTIPYTSRTVMNLCADTETLCADTGWKPEVSFEEGISRIINAYRR